jgi:CRP-like cAMP-binding protein
MTEPQNATRGLAVTLRELFPHAQSGSIDALRTGALIASYRRNDTIRPSSEGRPPVVLVLEGVVGRRSQSPNGHEFMEGLLERGSIGGLTALGTRRSSEVEFIARTDVIASSWTPTPISRIAKADGGLLVDLLDHALRLAVEFETMLESRTFQTADIRMARLLTDRAHLVFDPQMPVVRRSELGRFVGVSREMSERIVRDFEQRGFIRRVGRSGLQELDRAGLLDMIDRATTLRSVGA